MDDMYDLIGDIHGHAAALERLLGLLGYSRHGGVHRHPSRQVIFLGDFIDRGPAIRETLALVRAMVEAGTARAVMGNHELNALAFHTPDPHAPGEHLRRHNEMHSRQHAETVRQLPGAQLTDALDWFRTLPLWLDLDGFRVVHACWDEMLAARVADHLGEPPVTDDFLLAACHRDGPLFRPVETLLKGKEVHLPEGVTNTDKDGHVRRTARMRWFDDPTGHTIRSYALEEIACDAPLPQAVIEAARPYPQDEKPVFVGHYWMRGERPVLLAPNVACLDWSIAKGGFLCGYRWNGERSLDPAGFVWTT
jgi:hypothetical protein